MLVVADTTPLRYLVEIEAVFVLPVLFQEVVIPPAVLAELDRSAAPRSVRAWLDDLPAWLRVQRPAPGEVLPGLDPGESEAIRLACEINADLLLIDEHEGSRVAARKGLAVTGTLGVLDVGAERGLIDLSPVLDRLIQTSFRCTPELLDRLRHKHTGRVNPSSL